MTARKLLCCIAAALLLAPASASAITYVGDLVYCDQDANGVFDGSDYPLNGVELSVTCQDASGATCIDTTATTGELHPSVNPDTFDAFCSEYVSYSANGDIAGRYAVEITGLDVPDSGTGSCTFGFPATTCTVVVNPDTVPADCSSLVTPVIDTLPLDGNTDGDFCDPEDGPFPEGQILGDQGVNQADCDARPGTPGDGSHTVVLGGPVRNCSVYADFGYTPDAPPPGATRTIGYWKTHPDAIAANLPIDFCGETITEVCDAVALLQSQGGDLGNFTRQAVGALLNCSEFGCPAEIAQTIADGSAACAAGDDAYPYGGSGTVLDLFNNSGDDITPEGFGYGPADPKFCR